MSSRETVVSPLLKRIPHFRSSNPSIMMFSSSRLYGRDDWDKLRYSTQIQLLEEVVALVVDDDEGRKIHDLDAPDRFHAELGIFDDLDLLDAVFGKVGRRAPDRTEIESAVLFAGLGHGRRAVALGQHHHRSARGLELVDKGIHPSRRGRAERAGG